MICPNCGKTINDGDIFCAYCRSRVNAQPTPTPVQPTYQQQTFQPNAPIKKNNTSALLAGLLACGVLAAAFLLFVKPGYMLKKQDGSSNQDTKSDSVVTSAGNEITAERSEPISAEMTAAPEVTYPTVASTPVENAAETTIATTEAVTTTAAPQPAEDHSAALAEAAGYSTRERPTPEEFGWCYGQFGYTDKMPEGCERMTDPYGWSGDWKVLMITDPGGNNYICTSNFYITVENGSADIIIDWYYSSAHGEAKDNISIYPDSTYSGTATEESMITYGGGKMTLKEFWKQDGKEYAVGDIVYEGDGSNYTYVALMRP